MALLINFTNQALSAATDKPANLNWSLSGTGTYKTVELLTSGTGIGTLSTKVVQGVLFSTLLSSAVSPASGTGSFATLSAATGLTFRVDAAHNTRQFAVLYTDESSSVFTCLTASALATAQQLSANSFDNSWPEIRRLVTLGYH